MKELRLIENYFEFLDKTKYQKLELFISSLKEWNQKINLISRTDIDHLIEHHLLPSLSIARCCNFSSMASILDVGTGGGFPGIPLAIVFPETKFLLIDSIGKKIRAVQSMVELLQLNNVRTLQIRAEDVNEKFDFILGRAVTALPQFIGWIKNKIRSGFSSSLPNGVLYLKGGNFSEEIKGLNITPTQIFSMSEFFNNQYCQDKCIIYFSKKSLDKKN